MTLYTPAILDDLVETVRERLGERVAATLHRCLRDTLDRTIELQPDGTAFIITGDIPAMWLRDSTTQLTPLLHLLERDGALADTVAAVSRRQLRSIIHDPYANAFNVAANGAGHRDVVPQSPWVWERKYEIDSLAYPLQLAYDLWSATGRTDHLDDLAEAAREILAVWNTEQRHDKLSAYRFERRGGAESDTLAESGRGPATEYTGMTWAGFRPSDDACTHGYNIPSNAFAAVTLGYLAELAVHVLRDEGLAAEAVVLRGQIEQGVREHGIVPGPDGDYVYAYEVDGRGGVLVADDANVPSLLSMPLLGWCAPDDELYRATRAMVLSPTNPFYYSGSAAAGVGSPHTPAEQVWPIAIAVQGLTALDRAEQSAALDLLLETDAGTGYMHESFHVDDPGVFTRPWFSWANAMFCELVLEVADLRAYRRAPHPEAVR